MPRFSRPKPLLGTAFAAALLMLLVAAGASPSQAGAAAGVTYGLTDDAWLQTGPGTLDDRLAKLDTLGVRIVRFSLRWNTIARAAPSAPGNPEDPAYDWSQTTPVLDGLKAHGIDVVLQLVGTPSWANGGKGTNYMPTSSAAFAGFAAAAAREYPWVRKWLIWNEPNQRRWLRPTSASLYVVRLLNPAYTAIHDAIPNAQVAGGGTAPRASVGGVSPVAWLTGMHAAHARLDAYAHNPYPLDPKRETPVAGGCTHCATITMATLNRLVTLVAHDFPRAHIWLTEYGYQTNPPDRILGVAPALQARYISQAAYVAYRTPRVDMLIQFLYRDEPTLSRFQSGLVTLGDAEKPGFAAFELPLVETARTGTRTSLWGQLRAPDAGSSATLERRVGSTWTRFATVTAGTRGFFRFTGTLRRGTVVRVHAGALVGAPLPIS